MSTYTIPDTIRSTKTEDGALVLAIHTGKVLRLNPTGSLVFEQLQGGATEPEIIDAITKRCGISSEVASQDLCEFLKELEQLGLVYQSEAVSHATGWNT